MHSTEDWREVMADLGFRTLLASRLQEGQSLDPGTVVIWDRCGARPHLYAVAYAVFVGGTVSQGGQNFLEPLSAGIEPCIGPSLENFSWALPGGPDGSPSLEDAGLIHLIQKPCGIIDAMLAYAEHQPSRNSVRERFRTWLSARVGGSALAAREIERHIIRR